MTHPPRIPKIHNGFLPRRMSSYSPELADASSGPVQPAIPAPKVLWQPQARLVRVEEGASRAWWSSIAVVAGRESEGRSASQVV